MADPAPPTRTAADPSGASRPGMTVVYDGECPFCASYVRMMALRKATGSVELVDARSSDPRVLALWQQGYDLNNGMAALFGAKVYYGSDALALISTLTTSDGIGARLLARLLRNPERARILYPPMKFGRRIVLRVLGRPDLVPVLD